MALMQCLTEEATINSITQSDQWCLVKVCICLHFCSHLRMKIPRKAFGNTNRWRFKIQMIPCWRQPLQPSVHACNSSQRSWHQIWCEHINQWCHLFTLLLQFHPCMYQAPMSAAGLRSAYLGFLKVSLKCEHWESQVGDVVLASGTRFGWK